MKKGMLSLLFAGMLVVPTAASASLVSWLFQGQLNFGAGSDTPAAIHVGDLFSAILHFDTATPANNNAFNQNNCFPTAGGPGSICRHNGAPVSSQYWSDITINNINYGVFPPFDPAATFNNSIIVRNNATDAALGTRWTVIRLPRIDALADANPVTRTRTCLSSCAGRRT